MDKTRCEIYHAFDGCCCTDDEPCPFKPKPATAIEIVARNAEIQRIGLAVLVFLALVNAVFLSLLVGERQLAREARINQERIVWK